MTKLTGVGVAALAAGMLVAGAALGSDWTITPIAKPGNVGASTDVPQALSCDSSGCKTRPVRSNAKPAPDGLPDGFVARADDYHTIREAWYELPTRRYAHGILGDAIEAGRLVVRNGDGKRFDFELSDHQVFEDRTPRIVDFEGFGTSHIVTILSGAGVGASVAVFGVVDDELQLVAQTEPIGLSNRWLNIAGIDDFDGDGSTQIAAVETPHIGGTLKFWTWKKGKLKLTTSLHGFSNHQIGSREQELSVIEDFNNDGVLDLALPDDSRSRLRIVSFEGEAEGEKTLKELANIPLPARIDKVMRVHVSDDGQTIITLGLDDGSVVALWK